MSQALATRPRELTAGDLESAVLEVLTHRRRCTTIEDIVRILQAAGALKNSRIALIFPTHPHRMAVAEAVTRLHKAGGLAFMDVDAAADVSRGTISQGIPDACAAFRT
jgi:hypothetical protein